MLNEAMEGQSGSRRDGVRKVHSKSDLADVERLRFQIYCEEKRWLDPSLFPDGRERDAFDDASVHFAVRRRGQVVAAARLVLTGPFPLEHHCSIDSVLVRGGSVAEVSRLVVHPSHRRPMLRPTQAGERLVLLDLLAVMARFSMENGILRWVAAMEPTLARLFSVVGLPFDKVGPIADYFGPVAPYTAPVERLVGALGRFETATVAA